MTGCAVFELGILRGHSRDPSLKPELDSAWWAAPGLRLGLELPVAGPLLLGVAGELLVVLQKHEIVVDRPENRAIHTLPGLAQRGLVTLGIEVP
jgi:hypothetical protein